MIRLDGTNAERGPGDPRPSTLSDKLQSKSTMLEAAKTAVELREREEPT